MRSGRSPESPQAGPSNHGNGSHASASIAVTTMSSRPQATAIQPIKSTSQSENSHSSESAASHPSNISSNTSWATHSLPTASSAAAPLPKGAGSPEASPPILEYEAISPSPSAKRRSRVLRKSPPPAYHGDGGARRWKLFQTSSRSPSPGSTPRVRVNLDDNASFGATSSVRRVSLSATTIRPPPSSYGISRRSSSPFDNIRAHSIGRSASVIGQYAYDPVTRSSDAMDRLRVELARVSDHNMSNAGTSKERGPATVHYLPPAHRNKPLPAPPVVSHASSSSSAASQPIGSPPFRPPLSYRYSSCTTPSDVEQAESRFGFFNSGPSVSAPGLAYEQGYAYTPHMSWSDIGHTSTWSESEHVTSIGCGPRSDTHYPHMQQQHLDLSRPSPHPSSSLSTSFPFFVRRTSSSVAAFPVPSVTTTQSAHSASLSTSRPPDSQVPPRPVRKISLSKRIKRSLSITLFRKDGATSHTRRVTPYSDSEPGHGSVSTVPISLEPSLTPWPQQEPDITEQVPKLRKLKKRAPSLSNSFTSTSVSILTSRSTSALYPPASAPGGSSHELANSISGAGPGFASSIKPTLKKRTKSNPTQFASASSPPPVPPLPGRDHSMPNVTARGTQSQPSTPISLSSRKLTKRRVTRKVESTAGKDLDLTLPAVRAVSPLNIDLKGTRFSDASRSHSTPNLGPFSSGFEDRRTPQYLALTTDSPPSTPHDREPPANAHPTPEAQSSRKQDRPSFLRSQSNRRWTLAVSEVPDEQLVEELERLRSIGWGLGFQGELVRVKGKETAVGTEANVEPGGVDAEWGEEEVERWLVARKALMVCREIVRTEKSYRDGLARLQRGETHKTPPPLLLQYLPALISASKAFSTRLDEDPSAWGVSAAFLGAEDELEVAFVAWSGVVGEFFSTNKGKQRRQSTVDDKQLEKEKKDKERKDAGVPILPPVGLGDERYKYQQHTYIETKNAPGSWRMSMPTLSHLLTGTPDTSPTTNRKPGPMASAPASKIPTVQDLAIQPTQRVMRYVLLYKDLLNSTPIASPARALVERALEGATRIAQRCNRAQDNAAFLT